MEKTYVFQFLQSYSAKHRLYTCIGLVLILIGLFGITDNAFAHGVTTGDKGYI